MGMVRLKATLFGEDGRPETAGKGTELDGLGFLLDMPRRGYGPDRAERDAEYRERLAKHPLVRLLTEYE